MARLEGLLERKVVSKEKERSNRGEIEKLQKEIENQQKEIRINTFGPNGGAVSEVDRLWRETKNLEKLLRDLNEELIERERNPSDTYYEKPNLIRAEGLGDYEDWDEEKVALEIDLQMARARVRALQNEIDNNDVKYQTEIEHLKVILEEKQILKES